MSKTPQHNGLEMFRPSLVVFSGWQGCKIGAIERKKAAPAMADQQIYRVAEEDIR